MPMTDGLLGWFESVSATVKEVVEMDYLAIRVAYDKTFIRRVEGE
jgi:hypothetical protein